MNELPSFLEDHISQIPALQLLQNLGWQASSLKINKRERD
jgi:hypothetical protein